MRIEFTPEGIFLPQIGLWLDPARDTGAAWNSHAPFIAYGQTVDRNGARLTAFPSGHMPGAAQLLVEYEGERVVYTGHVKLRPPVWGTPYEPVPCDHLIIESTYGLPIYHFLSREEARERVNAFVLECFEQKLKPVFISDLAQQVEHALPEPGAAVIAPLGHRAGKGFRAAYVSGRAALDNGRAHAGAEELIPYSSHADFDELFEIVKSSGAREVNVVGRHAEAFSRILKGR